MHIKRITCKTYSFHKQMYIQQIQTYNTIRHKIMQDL